MAILPEDTSSSSSLLAGGGDVGITTPWIVQGVLLGAVVVWGAYHLATRDNGNDDDDNDDDTGEENRGVPPSSDKNRSLGSGPIIIASHRDRAAPVSHVVFADAPSFDVAAAAEGAGVTTDSNDAAGDASASSSTTPDLDKTVDHESCCCERSLLTHDDDGHHSHHHDDDHHQDDVRGEEEHRDADDERDHDEDEEVVVIKEESPEVDSDDDAVLVLKQRPRARGAVYKSVARLMFAPPESADGGGQGEEEGVEMTVEDFQAVDSPTAAEVVEAEARHDGPAAANTTVLDRIINSLRPEVREGGGRSRSSSPSSVRAKDEDAVDVAAETKAEPEESLAPHDGVVGGDSNTERSLPLTENEPSSSVSSSVEASDASLGESQKTHQHEPLEETKTGQEDGAIHETNESEQETSSSSSEEQEPTAADDEAASSKPRSFIAAEEEEEEERAHPPNVLDMLLANVRRSIAHHPTDAEKHDAHDEKQSAEGGAEGATAAERRETPPTVDESAAASDNDNDNNELAEESGDDSSATAASSDIVVTSSRSRALPSTTVEQLNDDDDDEIIKTETTNNDDAPLAREGLAEAKVVDTESTKSTVSDDERSCLDASLFDDADADVDVVYENGRCVHRGGGGGEMIASTTDDDDDSSTALSTGGAPFAAYVCPGERPLVVPSSYLSVCRGNARRARSMWIDTQRWRRDEGVWNVHAHPHPTFDTVRKAYPRIVHGVSKSGVPVLYERPGEMELTELMREAKERGGGTDSQVEDAVARHHVYLMEYLRHWVCGKAGVKALVKTEGSSDSDTGSSTAAATNWGVLVIVDMRDASRALFNGEDMRCLRRIKDINTAHYPAAIGQSLLINTPFWLWPGAGHMILPAATAVEWSSGGERKVLESLRGVIDDDQIPQEYGGSSRFPLGEHPFELGLTELAARGGADCSSSPAAEDGAAMESETS